MEIDRNYKQPTKKTTAAKGSNTKWKKITYAKLWKNFELKT